MRTTIIGAFCALSACAPIAQTSLDTWSPLETDPAVLRAAVDLPGGVGVPKDGAVLTFGAVRQDNGQAASQTFTLVQGQTAQGQLVFRLSDEDVAAYRTLQRQIGAWEAAAPDATDGTFSINVAACRMGDGPSDDAELSIFVDPGTGAGWVAVVEDAPIQDAIAMAQVLSDAC